jgi:hypothetical protein
VREHNSSRLGQHSSAPFQRRFFGVPRLIGQSTRKKGVCPMPSKCRSRPLPPHLCISARFEAQGDAKSLPMISSAGSRTIFMSALHAPRPRRVYFGVCDCPKPLCCTDFAVAGRRQVFGLSRGQAPDARCRVNPWPTPVWRILRGCEPLGSGHPKFDLCHWAQTPQGTCHRR